MPGGLVSELLAFPVSACESAAPPEDELEQTSLVSSRFSFPYYQCRAPSGNRAVLLEAAAGFIGDRHFEQLGFQQRRQILLAKMLTVPDSRNCLQLLPRAGSHRSLEQGTNLRGDLRGRLVCGAADERRMDGQLRYWLHGTYSRPVPR